MQLNFLEYFLSWIRWNHLYLDCHFCMDIYSAGGCTYAPFSFTHIRQDGVKISSLETVKTGRTPAFVLYLIILKSGFD